ncbi:hypothetical protein DWY47_18165, partial [Ruminococcus sp. AF25-23LB]
KFNLFANIFVISIKNTQILYLRIFIETHYICVFLLKLTRTATAAHITSYNVFQSILFFIME